MTVRGIGVDVEIVLIDLRRRHAREAPAERHGFAHRGHADARIGVPALEQRSGLLGALGPEHAEMALAGNVKPGVHIGRGAERQRDRAAEAQRAAIATAAHHHPACAGGNGADPQRGADRIDDEQHEDDAEAAERCARKVGRIEPSAAIGQARQQQRDADAAFGERHDEGDGRDRQRHQHVFRGHHQRRAQEGDHRADAG